MAQALAIIHGVSLKIGLGLEVGFLISFHFSLL
jgi:hypothetical protein